MPILGKQRGWREAAPLPLRVQEIYPCLHQGDLWVAGGLSPDVPEGQLNISDRVVRFSIREGRWQAAPTLPEPRHHGFLVSTDNELLVFGGFIAANGGRWRASRDILRLTDATLTDGKWAKISQLPTPQSETVIAMNSGMIHLAGGRAPAGESNQNWRDQIDVATHHVFDTTTNETHTAAPLPVARNSAASFVIHNQWHVVAGRTVAGGNTARHDIYDFKEDRWRTGAPLPQAQGGLAAASHGQHGYVFGGEYFSADGNGVYAEIWHYDSAIDRWHDAGLMPMPRHGLGAVAVDDAIYVIAGATEAGGAGTSNRMSVFLL